MSAAAEYYGYLLSQGYDKYQLSQFSEFAKRANAGEISHNKAYRLACKAGFNNVEGSEDSQKGFIDWMKMGQEAGWIDRGVSPNLAETQEMKFPEKESKKENSLFSKGLLIVGIGITIYLITRKK